MELWDGPLEAYQEASQLQNNFSFVVGDGKRISFCGDPWCNDIPLCLSFPALYDLAGNKGARVVDLWVAGSWDFGFDRHFNDWELASVQQFLSVVGQNSLNLLISDKFFGKFLQMVCSVLGLVSDF